MKDAEAVMIIILIVVVICLFAMLPLIDKALTIFGNLVTHLFGG